MFVYIRIWKALAAVCMTEEGNCNETLCLVGCRYHLKIGLKSIEIKYFSKTKPCSECMVKNKYTSSYKCTHKYINIHACIQIYIFTWIHTF